MNTRLPQNVLLKSVDLPQFADTHEPLMACASAPEFQLELQIGSRRFRFQPSWCPAFKVLENHLRGRFPEL